MKLVTGLGNPGEKYQYHRHNVGRMVVEKMMEAGWQGLNGALVAKSGEMILAKSKDMYMNESGIWVKRIRDFYKLENTDVLVVYDDLDLELGRVLVSDRGPKIHNGVNSVISAMGEGFLHVRCGVDDRRRDRSMPGEEYVLRNFPDSRARDRLVESAIDEINKAVVG